MLQKHVLHLNNEKKHINRQPATNVVSIKYHQILSFFFLLFSYLKSLFYNRKKDNTPKQPSIQELSKQFADKRTEEFLQKYNTIQNPNVNIEPTFYNKKEYIETLVSETNNLENTWKTRILIQKTPRGNVAMFYNVYKLGFSYYSDQHMPYNILNAIAMKYVMMFQCRDFFLDEEITPVSSPLLKLLEEDKKPNDEENDNNKKKEKEELKNMLKSTSAFAKLKNYKLETKNNKNTGGENNLETTEESSVVKKEQKIIERNRFIYLGKMTNFSFLKKPEKKKTSLFETPVDSKMTRGLFENSSVQSQVFSYRDFKNKQNIKN